MDLLGADQPGIPFREQHRVGFVEHHDIEVIRSNVTCYDAMVIDIIEKVNCVPAFHELVIQGAEFVKHFSMDPLFCAIQIFNRLEYPLIQQHQSGYIDCEDLLKRVVETVFMLLVTMVPKNMISKMSQEFFEAQYRRTWLQEHFLNNLPQSRAKFAIQSSVKIVMLDYASFFQKVLSQCDMIVTKFKKGKIDSHDALFECI